MPEAINYVHSEQYQKTIKSYAGKSNITKEKKAIYQDIKEKKEKGLKRLDVYKEYKKQYSIGGFNKIWYKL